MPWRVTTTFRQCGPTLESPDRQVTVQGRFQRRKHGTQAHHRNGHPSTWAWVTSFRTEDVAPGKRGP